MARSAKNNEIADELCMSDKYIEDLVYIEDYDIFYIWNDNYYRMVNIREMQRRVHKYIKSQFPSTSITKSMVCDVIEQIKWSAVRIEKEPNIDYIAFYDCYYNLMTGEYCPTSKDIIVTHGLPLYSQEIKDAININFNNFLKSSLVFKNDIKKTDESLISFTQEMFGYLLLDSNPVDVAFFLVGEGSNGKSVMTNIIQYIIGYEYCSNMSIQELTTDKFSTEYLINKKLNVSSEEESKYIAPDKFKALVGHDMVNAERKFGNKFSFRPRTKYIFASNELPTFKGINYGLERRMKIIPFYRRFENKDQDKELFDKLKKELAGIIRWSIDGLKRLQDNNYLFTTPEAMNEELSSFREEISSPIMFINDQYEITNGDYKTENDELYAHYVEWCRGNGKKGVVSKSKFGREINNNIPGLQDLRMGGKRSRNLTRKYIDNSKDDFEIEDII